MENATRVTRRTSNGAPRRRLGLALVSTMSVAALVLALAPFGAGAAPASTLAVAPYHGKVAPWGYSGYFGCAHDTTMKAWGFNLSSGTGGWAGAASSKSCAAANSSSYIDSGVLVSIPLKIAHSGLFAVKVHFLVSFHTAGTIATSGTCASTKSVVSWGWYWTGQCNAVASVFNAPYLWIDDLTTGSLASYSAPRSPFNLTVESYEYVDWGCYNPSSGLGCWSANYTYKSTSMSWSVSVHGAKDVVSLPGYFTKGDKYVLWIDGITYVGSDAYGWTSATASSALNFGTHGNGVTLQSITLI